MKSISFISRVFRKLIAPIFQIMKKDYITRTKVMVRKDLLDIGTSNEGWIIPANELNKDSICYCFGCGEDISFDLGLIDKFGCHVYGFDPTPRAIKYVTEHTRHTDKYHFFDFGLWDKEDRLRFYAPKNPAHVSHSLLNLQKTNDYIEVRVRRLKDIMLENGHRRLDLLKIDIEGAEYKVIDSIIEDKVNIKVLCLEYHECSFPLDRKHANRKYSIEQLYNYGFVLVNVKHFDCYTFVRKAEVI